MLKSYNDFLRNLLSGIDCILAYDTAADYLGLSNGGYRDVVQIFVEKKQNIDGVEQFVVPSLEQIESELKNGLYCTTVNRTIIDLLKQDGDEQIITESLANYYDENNNSFNGLIIPDYLKNNFNKYKLWAEEYYCE